MTDKPMTAEEALDCATGRCGTPEHRAADHIEARAILRALVERVEKGVLTDIEREWYDEMCGEIVSSKDADQVAAERLGWMAIVSRLIGDPTP